MAACGVVCLQVCGALSRRVRRPIVQLEYPLVAGTDAEDVEEAKTQLLQLLKGSLGLTEKADEAPVSDRHISSITKEVHPLAHRESSPLLCCAALSRRRRRLPRQLSWRWASWTL